MLDGLPQTLRPTQEAVQKLGRVQGAEHAVERIVRGNPVGQFQKRLEPFVLGVAEVLHVVEAFSPAQQRADPDDQHIDQTVFSGSRDARIGYLAKAFQQTAGRLQISGRGGC